jgi:competence protein ComEC
MNPTWIRYIVVRISGLGFPSDFWFRVSGLPRHSNFVIRILFAMLRRMSDLSGKPTQSLVGLTRWPAVSVAILLLIGILLHDLAPVRPFHILTASAMLAVFASSTIRWRFICAAALGVLVILLGIGIAQREHFEFSPNDVGLFATDEPHLTELEIRIVDEPQMVTGPPGSQRPLPPKQITMADVLRIKTWDGWIDATGRMPLQINQPVASLQAGQTVRVLGMLQRPRAAMNPGEFDWAAYYRQQRILATFTTTRAGDVHILKSADFNWIGWMRSKTHHLLAAGFTSAHAKDYALLDALTLGNRDPELRDIQDEFKQTGMGYQLSVSGLHIALLAGAVFWLCRCVRLRPRYTLLITTAFVLLYASVSLPSHSGTRAAILCIVIAVATLIGRSTDRLQLLALAVIAMLLWHPMDLYSAGFHLSFAVAVVFLFLLPRFKQWLKSREDADELAKPHRREPGVPHQILAWVGRCFTYGLFAWLATLPLVAYHFGSASGWAILSGLLMFPVVVVALFAGVLKVLLTLLWPALGGAWATAAGWPVELLQWGVHQLARLPGSSIALPSPPVWLVILCYMLLFAPMLPYSRMFSGRRRWILRLAPLAGVAAIFSVALLPIAAVPTGELRITLLSLGAGQCAVVEPPGGQPVLIDAGSSTVADVAMKLVEPFLRAEGQQKVGEIFLSHGDFDHISAAGEITVDYGVKQVFTSYHFVRNSAGNLPDQMLLDELEKLNRTPTQIATGDHFDIGGGVVVEVLWPPKDRVDLNSNNAGLVLRLTYAGRSMLFPADIQDPAFAGVLQNASALKSDVLVAPHHGSSEELTPAFMAAVHPQMILSSNFWRLTSKQRRFETMIGQMPLYRTPECGAITVTIRKDGTLSVTTFVKGAVPKYAPP